MLYDFRPITYLFLLHYVVHFFFCGASKGRKGVLVYFVCRKVYFLFTVLCNIIAENTLDINWMSAIISQFTTFQGIAESTDWMPMEFLQLVIIYVTLFFTSVGIYFYRDARIFKNGLLGKLCAFTRLVFVNLSYYNHMVPLSITMDESKASQCLT